MESRCLQLFESSCKTKATWKAWSYAFTNFLEFSKLKADSFLSLNEKEIVDVILDYVLYQKRRIEDNQISANSLPDLCSPIFKFLKVNGKKVDIELITMHYPDKVKRGGERAITDDEIRALLSFADVRARALIHVVACTGARPEAIVELKMKYVEEYEDGFTKLTLYAEDFKHEYITFLSPEATNAFNAYLQWRQRQGEKITDESSFINQVQENKPALITTLHGIMHDLFKRAGIERKKTGHRFDLATFGGFRKRFITKLGLIPEISENAIQILVDHTGYLSGHYRKPTEEQIFTQYKKAVGSLVISREYQLKQELQEKTKENIEEKDRRIASLEATVSKLELVLMELSKKLE